ncbi:MAG TPA: hypothetical protein VH308_10440 [Terracidiphilus sp.]|nr:hypothetical protein [Terracidiphilus sp.]
MKSDRLLHKLLSSAAFAVCSAFLGHAGTAQIPAAHKTQNVIVVMMDGMRWQEVFGGADPKLIKTPGPKWLGDPDELAAETQKQYGLSTPAERRKALMPFLWNVVAERGQIFGNRDLGSDSHVINGFNFSYPGYAETLTGIADARVNSNDNVPNPNRTVFAWLNAKPKFAGKVAAFGAWGTFDGIFDKQKCGFVVNAGYEPLTEIPATPKIALLNALKAESPRLWMDESIDSLPFHTAVEYVKAKKPRVLFIGLGETDDWAHAGSYAEYLISAHLGDSYLREIWELVQSMPEYRDKTTLIVLPDHGRGVGEEWTTHGEKVPASKETWMAFMGPDTAARGERKQAGPVTESQVAATIAVLLGEDYQAAVPKSGSPIADVLGK